ncbi:MAG TPA: DUF4097 family beta strand repeat-containing protein [Gemmatimonadaceae bacterium]|nr:DUF4097 family beta strand repeat-containing protein [Gemmatimonadaceae bacterium]
MLLPNVFTIAAHALLALLSSAPATSRTARSDSLAALARPASTTSAAAPVRAVALRAPQPARYTLSGDDVAVWNLVGSITLSPGSGSQVAVSVTRAGRDAAQLTVQHGELDGHDALRVVYPARDIHFEAERGRRFGNGRVHLTTEINDNGTFAEDGAHRVRISSDGGDIDARADCQLLVPAGKTVTVHLAVGVVRASNVNGEISADVLAADVHGDHLQGALRVRGESGDVELLDVQSPTDVQTSSGDVTVRDARGDLLIATSSGDVVLDSLSATRASVRSSSGDIHAEGLTLDELAVHTSSGDVHLAGIQVPDVSIASSSGDVDAALDSVIKSATFSARSGNVTVRMPHGVGFLVDAATGSGDVNLGIPMQVQQRGKHRLIATTGSGDARVETSTASGDVRIVFAGESE